MDCVPLSDMNSEDFNMFLGDVVDSKDFLTEVVDEVIPDAYDTIPSNESFSGIYEFDVMVPPAKAKNLVYSPRLEKLFIKMSTDFTLLFSWKYDLPKTDLFVRAKPRFTNSEHANKPVKRCLQHANDNSNRDSNSLIRHHVLRCNNSQAVYEGGYDQHFSVVLPLSPPEVGTDSVSYMYQFVCQNSCASGMNRRPIEVIFTLEDHSGEIYGRKSINVRICSCPKRDKEKEEVDAGDICTGQPPPSKKLKSTKRTHSQIIEQQEEEDTKIHTLTIKMVGLKGKKALLESGYNILAGQMMLHPGNADVYKPILEDIRNQIHDCM